MRTTSVIELGESVVGRPCRPGPLLRFPTVFTTIETDDNNDTCYLTENKDCVFCTLITSYGTVERISHFRV